MPKNNNTHFLGRSGTETPSQLDLIPLNQILNLTTHGATKIQFSWPKPKFFRHLILNFCVEHTRESQKLDQTSALFFKISSSYEWREWRRIITWMGVGHLEWNEKWMKNAAYTVVKVTIYWRRIAVKKNIRLKPDGFNAHHEMWDFVLGNDKRGSAPAEKIDCSTFCTVIQNAPIRIRGRCHIRQT